MTRVLAVVEVVELRRLVVEVVAVLGRLVVEVVAVLGRLVVVVLVEARAGGWGPVGLVEVARPVRRLVVAQRGLRRPLGLESSCRRFTVRLTLTCAVLASVSAEARAKRFTASCCEVAGG